MQLAQRGCLSKIQFSKVGFIKGLLFYMCTVHIFAKLLSVTYCTWKITKFSRKKVTSRHWNLSHSHHKIIDLTLWLNIHRVYKWLSTINRIINIKNASTCFTIVQHTSVYICFKPASQMRLKHSFDVLLCCAPLTIAPGYNIVHAWTVGHRNFCTYAVGFKGS